MPNTDIPVSLDTKPKELIARIKDLRAEKKERRRDFLKKAGLLAGAAVAAPALFTKDAQAQRGAQDPLVLNFALNLEYLESEFYSFATTGASIEAAGVVTTGVGSVGSLTVKSSPKVPFTSTDIQSFAQEITADETSHVVFLRSALGSAAVARPSIDLLNSFNAAITAASSGSITTFDPFSGDIPFLLGGFIFEDVGVTAYRGGSTLLTNLNYLSAAAGILAVEAYHASLLRTVLYQNRAVSIAGTTVANVVQLISNLRDSVDNQDGSGTPGTDDDQGIVGGVDNVTTVSNIVPTDANGLAFSRDTASVLRIVYLGGAPGVGGGFLPAGMNGAIR